MSEDYKRARGCLHDSWDGEPAEVTLRRIRGGDVGEDNQPMTEPKPLTAQQVEEEEQFARTNYARAKESGDYSPGAARVLRWAATVRQKEKEIERLQYWEKQHIRHKAEIEAERDDAISAVGALERDVAQLKTRIAELRKDRDILRGRSPFTDKLRAAAVELRRTLTTFRESDDLISLSDCIEAAEGVYDATAWVEEDKTDDSA